MISERAAALLWDADRAIDRILRFISNCSFEGYLSDEMLQSAVERQLEVLGEALTVLRRTDPVVASTIPELNHAVALRNVLIHGYATVDHRIVWDVVQNHLSNLKTMLTSHLPPTN